MSHIMGKLLLIAFGGAAGALCRHWLMNAVNTWHHVLFPYGTLAVNVIGSLFIGIMYVLIVEKLSLHADWRNITIIGFLGAFTTFSTFSLEAVTLLENGQIMTALVYVLSSVVLCIIAVWVAMILTRLV